MTFLPIVERELRVASRRSFTYWSRLVAAGFLLIIFGMILTISNLSRGMGWSMGQVQFSVLKWIAFIFAASVGVFLTSDALSEEKREGTLGLLFLTDLRGFDVVFGKLISQSLRAFYGLLAAFPILALPLLAGGVTGAEFGRVMLVICNTLFLSLAIGLFVSSLSREVMKAMNGALLLSLLFLVGLPWADMWLAHWNETLFKCIFSMASPGYLFVKAPNLHPHDYWLYLGVQHLLGWGFLAVACVIVPRAWQEKTSGKISLLARLSGTWRYGGRRGRLAFRNRLLGRDPILWLALRDRWLPRFVLVVSLLMVGWAGWDLYSNWISSKPFPGTTSTWGLLMTGVVLWMSSQACRLYLDSVRNGAMELILVTPMSPSQLVRGQWAALWRTFIIPLCLVLTLHLVDGINTIITIKKSTPPGGYPAGFSVVDYQIVGLITGVVNLVFRLAALGWFGMWMGLTNRKVSVAVLKSIVF
ncbi:MAG: family transporter protein, partial [Pedosphaera sp.]|nr:family transporter protein [Pedosphaera sp.]